MVSSLVTGIPRNIRGWLFDLYPSPQGIVLWLVDREGRKHRCSAPFVPSFFLHVADADARLVADLVRSFPFRVTLERTEQKEIYSNTSRSVIRVHVHDATNLKNVVRRLERHFPHFVFFN